MRSGLLARDQPAQLAHYLADMTWKWAELFLLRAHSCRTDARDRPY